MKRGRTNAVLGLDLGKNTIKAVEMIRNGTALSIRNCSLVEASPSSYVDSIASVVKVGGYRAGSVAIAVSGRGVLLQTISVPADRADALDAIIREEASRLLPYSVDEAALDYSIDTDSHDRNLSVLIAGVKKSDVMKHCEMAMEAGIHPARVEIELLSLANALDAVRERDSSIPPGVPLCFVDFGASKTLILVSDGVTRLFHEFPFGGDKLTEMIAHRLGCGPDEAEEAKLDPGERMDMVKDAIYPGLEDMTAEVRTCMTRFRQQTGQEPAAALVSGGLLGFPELLPLLSRLVRKDVRVFDPFGVFPTGDLDPDFIREYSHRFSVAFGLACHAGE